MFRKTIFSFTKILYILFTTILLTSAGCSKYVNDIQTPGYQEEHLHIKTASLSNAQPVGPLRTAIIIVNFQDNPTYQPISTSTIQNFYFGTTPDTINGFFRENSYNQTSLFGDVLGYYTIPIMSSDLVGPDDIALLTQSSYNTVTAAGIDLTKYQLIIYMCASTTSYYCKNPHSDAGGGYLPSGSTQWTWFG